MPAHIDARARCRGRMAARWTGARTGPAETLGLGARTGPAKTPGLGARTGPAAATALPGSRLRIMHSPFMHPSKAVISMRPKCSGGESTSPCGEAAGTDWQRPPTPPPIHRLAMRALAGMTSCQRLRKAACSSRAAKSNLGGIHDQPMPPSHTVT